MLSIQNLKISKFLALNRSRNLINIWLVINIVLLILIIYFLYFLFNQQNLLENSGRIISSEINNMKEYRIISYKMSQKGNFDKISGIQSDEAPRDYLSQNIIRSRETIAEVHNRLKFHKIQWKENYNALFIDYENLQKENELLIEYLTQLGDEEAGIYAKLNQAASDFRSKYQHASSGISSVSSFEKIFTIVELLKNHRDENLIYEVQEKIDEIFEQLNHQNPDSSNYMIARVGDALGGVKLAFQEYARKLFEIGLSSEKGLTQKLNDRYDKIDYRLKTSLDLIYAERSARNLSSFVFLIVLILILLAFNIGSFYFYSKRESGFKRLSHDYLKSLEKGKFYQFNKNQLPEGLGRLVEIMEDFAAKYINAANTLASISGGNVKTEINRDEHFEGFYPLFIKLKKNIEDLNLKLRDEKSSHSELVWIKKGIDKLTEVMRQEYENPLLHANEIINMLVAYLDVPIGAIYLMKEENGEKFVELASAFAFGKEKQLYRKLAFGEGIVGTAAAERKTYNITNVPGDYFNIVSAFGETKPKNVVVSPIKLGDEIYGVIELASLSRFKPEEIVFIEEVCKTVAYSFAISKVYVDTLSMFENSNLQIAQLESENQLLINDYDDLKKTYKEHVLKSGDNEFLVSRFNELSVRLTLDLDGNILEINPRFEMIFKTDRMKFIQTNYRDYLSAASFSGDLDFEYFWKEIRAGITLDIEFGLTIAGIDYWFKQYFYPVKDEAGRVKKIQVIGFDITDKVRLERELAGLKDQI